MSGSRNYLAPYIILSNGDMSQASLTSTVTNIKNLDNICVYLSWTGTPTGTFNVYGNLTNDTSNGVPMSFATSPVASGSAGSILIDMNNLSFPYLYVTYTKTSGTGTLTATISGKGW